MGLSGNKKNEEENREGSIPFQFLVGLFGAGKRGEKGVVLGAVEGFEKGEEVKKKVKVFFLFGSLWFLRLEECVSLPIFHS